MTISETLEITATNLAEMLEAANLPFVPEENRSAISFWPGKGDLPVCTAIAKHASNHADASRRIVLRDKKHGLLFVARREAVNRSFLERILGREQLGEWRLECFGADSKDGNNQPVWQPIQLPVPVAYRGLLKSLWPLLVDGLRGHKNASALITPNELRGLFALTVAEPYLETRGSFSAGPVTFGFVGNGQKNDSEEGNLLELEIVRDFLRSNGQEKIETYHYTLRKTFEGDEFVELGHHFEGAPTVDLLYKTDDYRVERAIRTFRLGRHNLNRAEQALLQGGLAPDPDAVFAIKHWRDKGISVLSI